MRYTPLGGLLWTVVPFAVVALLFFGPYSTARPLLNASNQVCLVHVGSSDKPMPTVCVILRPDNAIPKGGYNDVTVTINQPNSFLRVLQDNQKAPPPDYAAFGTYEIETSAAGEIQRPWLTRDGMRNVIEEIIGDLTLGQQPEAERLEGIARRLAG